MPFLSSVQRKVRKDGTVSYLGQDFEVPYELSGKSVRLIVDPHAQPVAGIEDEGGNSLGAATPLDALANCHRRRRKPEETTTQTAIPPAAGPNLVELAYNSITLTHRGAILMYRQHFGIKTARWARTKSNSG